VQKRIAATRAPALHPGDVQVASPVDVPRDSPLNALHSVLVFSQQGARDLPSQLSGSDLDGDIFHIIYDPCLVPLRIHAPADYAASQPRENASGPVTSADIANSLSTS
jgi:hypothetical protein